METPDNRLLTINSKFPQWQWIAVYVFNRSRISSVVRALDCGAGGRGFDSRDRNNTHGLKITGKWRYSLCLASGRTFAWLGWPRKMAGSRTYTDTQIKCIFLLQHGKINEIRLVTNRAGKPKGFGYIEYEQEVSETAASLSSTCVFSSVCFSFRSLGVIWGEVL